MSAVLGAFLGHCTKEVDEFGIFGAVHYVGGEGFGDVNEFGCFVGVEVGGEVSTLADGCSCRFDRVVEEVATFVVCEVVGFFNLSRESVAEALFKVLSVVGVGSFDFGDFDVEHFHCPFFCSLRVYYNIFPRVCQEVFEKKLKKFFSWKSGLYHSSKGCEVVFSRKFSHEVNCLVGGEVGCDGGDLSSDFAYSDYFFHSV